MINSDLMMDYDEMYFTIEVDRLIILMIVRKLINRLNCD
jgi:hypothetical protein